MYSMRMSWRKIRSSRSGANII